MVNGENLSNETWDGSQEIWRKEHEGNEDTHNRTKDGRKKWNENVVHSAVNSNQGRNFDGGEELAGEETSIFKFEIR